MGVYVLAEIAALLFAVGSVVQQRAAAEAPPEKALSFSLLWFLVRQRRWLAGTACSLIGNLLAAAAISSGGVGLVEPLLTTRLLIVLPLTAVTNHMRIPLRDWLAALLAAGGLATFIAVGRPQHGPALSASTLRWAATVAAVAVVAALVVAIARRREATRAAFALGGAGGMLFGLQAALTETAVALVRHGGLVALVTHWQPLLVAVSAVCGAMLVQSAYEMAPLYASFPALVTVEPIAGMLVGLVVLHGVLDTAGANLFIEAAGLVVMVAAVAALARSPLVTGQALAMQRRREEGLAHRSAHHLEQLLGEAQEAVDGAGEGGRAGRHRIDQVRSRLERAEPLRTELTRLCEAEARHLRELPDKDRIALAPLEQELEKRRQRIEEWAAELHAAADRLDAAH